MLHAINSYNVIMGNNPCLSKAFEVLLLNYRIVLQYYLKAFKSYHIFDTSVFGILGNIIS